MLWRKKELLEHDTRRQEKEESAELELAKTTDPLRNPTQIVT